MPTVSFKVIKINKIKVLKIAPKIKSVEKLISLIIMCSGKRHKVLQFLFK
jgi:hypothetical protein